MNSLKVSLKCLANNIHVTEPDAVEHIFCYMAPNCLVGECRDRLFCLSVCQRVEKEINMRKQVAEALEK